MPGFGRPNLQRQFTASQLLEFDRSTSFLRDSPSRSQPSSVTRASSEADTTVGTQSEQPKVSAHRMLMVQIINTMNNDTL